MPQEILTFISSPGDGESERRSARLVIENLNSKKEIAGQGLHLSPVLWEDLPPGIAEGGDFQKRIDSLMKRGNYSGYGIYVGIMKRRLGTATPRYTSGTVEEFEQSVKRRKRIGMPAEILFYFIDDGTPPDMEVEEFKRRVEKLGLLYAEVPDEKFAERLEQNLFDITRSWKAWRAVLRRVWPPLRNVLGAVALCAVLALVLFDYTARHHIDQALASTELRDAVETWSGRRVLMLISGSEMRRRINAAIADRIAAANDVSARMSVFSRWQAEPVLLPQTRNTLLEQLGDGVASEIRADVLENRSKPALGMWHQARRVGIWDAFPDKAENAISMLAALRMIEALSAAGAPLGIWSETLLRPEQNAKLTAVASEILAHDPELSVWSNRRTSTAIALLSGRTDVLGQMAHRAARSFNTDAYPEIAAYVSREEAGALSDWLEATIQPDLPSHVVARILDAVQARGEPAAMLKMVELAVGNRFPDPGVALLSDYKLDGNDSAALATAFLQKRLGYTELPLGVHELVLPHLDVTALSREERASVTEALLTENEDGLPTEILEALSALDTERGRAALEKVLHGHLSGQTSFGFAERVALMGHIQNSFQPEQRLAAARQLFERSEEDRALIESPHSLNLGISVADGVERRYLEILAGTAALATEADREALGRIVERKSVQATSGPLAGVLRQIGEAHVGEGVNLRELGVALWALPEGWTIRLLSWLSFQKVCEGDLIARKPAL